MEYRKFALVCQTKFKKDMLLQEAAEVIIDDMVIVEASFFM